MSRAARLLDLLQALRRRRRPASAATLAGELGVSVRTIYRDIDTLVAQGARIEGEAGVGYVLRPGFALPPLMFSEEEIEALILGLRFVAQRGDRALAQASHDAAAKIEAVLPADLRATAAETSLLAAPTGAAFPAIDVAALRAAIRDERMVSLVYRDGAGSRSDRVAWPIAIGYFDHVEVLVAWCESRADFRHFRLDRIESCATLAVRIPRRRGVLLADWRAREGVGDPI